MFPDRVAVLSPGALPPGLSVESLREQPHPSERRNPLVAHGCFLARLVEQYGTGTLRMMAACEERGLPEPEFREKNQSFQVLFPLQHVTQEELEGVGLSRRQIQAVLALQGHKFSRKDYEDAAGVSRATANRDLETLQEVGVVTPLGGETRGRRYRVTPQ